MFGTFRAICMGNAIRKSKTKGTPSVSFKFFTKFEITNPLSPVNTYIYADLWLTPSCLDRTIKTLRNVFGWQGNNIKELNDPIFRDIEVDLVVQENENKYNEVKWINKPSGVIGVEDQELSEICDSIQPLLDNLNCPVDAYSDFESSENQHDMNDNCDLPF